MNINPSPTSTATTTSPAQRRAAERDDLRKRLVRLIADREAAKHTAKKATRGT
jgi:hypothetical protein